MWSLTNTHFFFFLYNFSLLQGHKMIISIIHWVLTMKWRFFSIYPNQSQNNPTFRDHYPNFIKEKHWGSVLHLKWGAYNYSINCNTLNISSTGFLRIATMWWALCLKILFFGFLVTFNYLLTLLQPLQVENHCF